MESRLPDGYTLRGSTSEALVYRSQQNTLLRAHCEKYGDVILKMNSKELVHTSDLKRLEKEFMLQQLLQQHLPVEDILQIYEKTSKSGFQILVMEDEGAISLDDFVQKQGKLSVEQFLNLGVDMARILAQIHKARLIHLDIKPSNILLNEAQNRLKFIDFATAAITTIQRPDITPAEVEGGTAQFMSPEQTGRVGSNVDRRSDIYSLGMSFYYLLKGEIAFNMLEREDIVAAHLSAKVPIIDDVPKPINDIIQKMVEKDSDSRYQNTTTLYHDLQSLQKYYQENNGSLPDDFVPAQNDVTDTFQLPTRKLYGRDKEIEELTGVVQDSLDGAKLLCLIKGFSGIGKTSLIREVVKKFQSSVFLTQGKFDQFNQSIPYSAIVQALKHIVYHMLGLSQASLRDLKANLHEKLKNAYLIADLVPEFKDLMDIERPKSTPTGDELQNRFIAEVCNFLAIATTVCSITTDEPSSEQNIIMLFLDDLQWADLNSLILIEKIVSDPNLPVIVLGAYRDNEVDETHPLNETIASMKKQNIPIISFKLLELSTSHLNELISDTTRQNLDACNELTEVVYQKTQGNPFFAREFLLNLFKKNLLTFNYETSQWEWEISSIQQMNFSDNVVDFMLKSISEEATDVTKDVLSYCAVIGTEFDIKTLGDVYEKSMDDTIIDLIQSLESGWIFKISQHVFKFAHDRIQEACYNLMEDEKRVETHYNLSLSIHKHAESEGKLEDNLFTIVNHFSKCIDLVKKDDDVRKLALNLFLRSSEKALDSSANKMAISYSRFGKALLIDSSWENEYETTFSLCRIEVVAHHNDKQFVKGIELGNEVLKSTKTKLDEFKIKNWVINMYTGVANYDAAYQLLIELVEQNSEYLNMEVSDEAKIGARFQELYGDVVPLMKDAIEHPEKLTLLKDEVLENLLLCFSNGAATFFLTANSSFSMYLQMACATTKLILQNGVCKATPILFGAFSLASFIISQDMKFSADTCTLAYNITVKYWPTDFMKCDAYYHYAFWNGAEGGTVMDSGKRFLATYRTGLSSGNNLWGAFGGNLAHVHMLFAGTNADELLEFVSRQQAFSMKCNNILNLLMLEDAVSVLRMLKGDRDTFTDKNDYVLKPEVLDVYEMQFFRVHSPLVRTWALIHYERFEEAWEYINRCLQFVTDCTPFLQLFIAPFVFCLLSAEILFRGLEEKIGKSKEELLQMFDQHLETLGNYSKVMPRYLTGAYHLAQADRERLKGADCNVMQVLELYQKAVNTCKNDELVSIQALAYCRLGEYMERLNFFPDSFVPMLNQAIQIYKMIGYNYVTTKLTERYADYFTALSFNSSAATATTTARGQTSHTRTRTTSETSTSDTGDSKEVAPSALRAASSFQDMSSSSGVNLKVLFSNMLPVIRSNIAATRVVLILKDKETEKLFVEAVVDLNDETSQLVHEEVSDEYASMSVVNRTLRSRKDTVIDDVPSSSYSSDVYFKEHPNIKSALATPIIHQNKAHGVLFLENSEMKNVFTADRAHLLSTINTVSIHNAEFFTTLTNSYARFLPRPFLELLGRKNILDVSQGDSKEIFMSIIFTDIRNFTGITEKLTAQGSMNFVNQFLEYLCPEIDGNEGFIDKFIGDAILALFPGPVSTALRAVTGMIAALGKLNRDHYANQDPLEIGIGLHYGKAQLGTVGYAARLDGTVIGDTVNTSSRLEGLTKSFGACIICSQEYYDKLQKEKPELKTIKFNKLGKFFLKGRTEPSELYEIYDTTWKHKSSPRAELPEVLQLFSQQKFQECHDLCVDLSSKYENKNILEFYIDACRIYQKYDLPKGWNGAIKLTKDGTAKAPDNATKKHEEGNMELVSDIADEDKEELERYRRLYGRLSEKPVSSYRIQWNEDTKRYERKSVTQRDE